ncbi:uncharacterized protein LOC123551024 isoform X2 [Mercenaria mercenaria]|uniref:uncharacterized protein LOC123551024 isoform X2 n=1 Tax=Mercenaria mercenaria TaxID=6596 RepID=UPI00234F155D|nr:uncharacterized protein LOC123551024 isoform X2 [Mercenaria mercenaria]
MGTTIYRVTGIMLSLTVAVLGAATAVLLYYAGQDGIDLFYKDSTYMDEHHRIHKRKPTDDWYGELILKGWAFGFVYVVPGLTGITASLFFEKVPMVIHLIIAILALVAGSFIHTAGTMAIILFRVFTVNGVIRYDSWPGDCIYIRYEDGLQQEVNDEKCETGRKALNLAIAAASVILVAWVFLLSEILFCGFTYHNIGKNHKKSVTTAQRRDEDISQPRERRSKRRRTPAPPHISTTEEQASASHNTASDVTPPTQTTPTFSTFQKRKGTSEAATSQQHDNNAYDPMEETGTEQADTAPASDVPASVEMADVQHGEITPL